MGLPSFLHSHSGLEREKRFPKHTVLVDEKFGDMFSFTKQFMYNGKMYYQVNTYEFVKMGGVFRNFYE